MLATREAIHAAGLITAGVAFGVAAPLAAGDPGWFDKPIRCAQLNSTEDNAAEMDIGFWMDYFQCIHADALCITAGGWCPSIQRKPNSTTRANGCRRAGLFRAGAGRMQEAGDDHGSAHRPARRL